MVTVPARPPAPARAAQFIAASSVGRLVRFAVGGDLFALPLEEVAEIVGLGASNTPTPRGWVGTLVRGERPAPIGDLAFLLGLPASTARRHDRCALILRSAADAITFGVTIDTVPAVIDASGIALQPLPPVARRAASGLVRGSAIVDGALLLILDREVLCERLLAGLTRDAAGRITELRALSRPFADTSHSGRARHDPPLMSPSDESRALVLAAIEAADGGEPFAPALPMAWVQEVRPFVAPRQLPLAPPAVIGLLARREQILPVLDLTRALTGLPGNERESRQRLLIVGQPGAAPLGALLVSGVRGLRALTFDSAGDTAPAAQLDPGLLHAWAREGEVPVAVLDPAAFFA